MKIDYFTYDIEQHWVCAIENGDYTALEDDEVLLLNEFLDGLPKNALGWHWGDEARFACDEISGLMGQCLEGKLYVQGADND